MLFPIFIPSQAPASHTDGTARANFIGQMDGLSNSARIYMRFASLLGTPTIEVQAEAWGQVCTGNKIWYAAACLRDNPVKLALFPRYVGWRCAPLDSVHSIPCLGGTATDADREAVTALRAQWKADGCKY